MNQRVAKRDFQKNISMISVYLIFEYIVVKSTVDIRFKHYSTEFRMLKS